LRSRESRTTARAPKSWKRFAVRRKTSSGGWGQFPSPSIRTFACWREAYRRFGAKPKDHPSSIENLVRRVSKGHSLRHVNRLVDLYNAISLKHLVPAGGEDLDAIDGDVELAFAGDAEPTVRLLGEPRRVRRKRER
jgi:DNA/RNA-binding domain of Phe-tRNA-synthetase-like protein